MANPIFGNRGAGYRNDVSIGDVLNVLGGGKQQQQQPRQVSERADINNMLESQANKDLLAEIARQSKNSTDVLTGAEMTTFLSKIGGLQQQFRFEDGPQPGTYVARYGNFPHPSQPMRISMEAIETAQQSGMVQWRGEVTNHPELVAARGGKPVAQPSMMDEMETRLRADLEGTGVTVTRVNANGTAVAGDTPRPAAGETIRYTNANGEKWVVSNGAAVQPTDEQRLNTLANQMNSINTHSGAELVAASNASIRTAQALVGKDDRFELYVPAVISLEDGKEITIPKGRYTTGSLLNTVADATGVDPAHRVGLHATATAQNVTIDGRQEKIITLSDVMIDASKSEVPLTPSALNMIISKANEANIDLDMKRLDNGLYRITMEGERGLGTALRFDAEASATLDRAIAAVGKPAAGISTAPVAPAPRELTAEEMNDRPAIYAREDAAVAAKAAPAAAPAKLDIFNSVANEISSLLQNRSVNDDAKAVEAFLKANPIIGKDGKPIVETRAGFKDDGILSEVESTAALNRAQALRWAPDGKGVETLTALETALKQAGDTGAALAQSGVSGAPKAETAAAKEAEPSQVNLPAPSSAPMMASVQSSGMGASV